MSDTKDPALVKIECNKCNYINIYKYKELLENTKQQKDLICFNNACNNVLYFNSGIILKNDLKKILIQNNIEFIWGYKSHTSNSYWLFDIDTSNEINKNYDVYTHNFTHSTYFTVYDSFLTKMDYPEIFIDSLKQYMPMCENCKKNKIFVHLYCDKDCNKLCKKNCNDRCNKEYMFDIQINNIDYTINLSKDYQINKASKTKRNIRMFLVSDIIDNFKYYNINGINSIPLKIY